MQKSSATVTRMLTGSELTVTSNCLKAVGTYCDVMIIYKRCLIFNVRSYICVVIVFSSDLQSQLKIENYGKNNS